MAKMSERWKKYEQLQAELAASRDVDDRAWSLEAGLNRILEGVKRTDDVERAVRSSSRKERDRRVITRAFRYQTDSWGDPELSIDIKDGLRRVQLTMTPTEWRLLCARAEGQSYDQLAVALKAKPGTLRVKVRRLRERARPIIVGTISEVMGG
jgi:hypothetical protein